jgi:hypothetical protein
VGLNCGVIGAAAASIPGAPVHELIPPDEALVPGRLGQKPAEKEGGAGEGSGRARRPPARCGACGGPRKLTPTAQDGGGACSVGKVRWRRRSRLERAVDVGRKGLQGCLPHWIADLCTRGLARSPRSARSGALQSGTAHSGAQRA